MAVTDLEDLESNNIEKSRIDMGKPIMRHKLLLLVDTLSLFDNAIVFGCPDEWDGNVVSTNVGINVVLLLLSS